MIETADGADTAVVLVYATFPDRDRAMTAGLRLIEARLAACINILPQMTSIYRWKGSIETSDEVILIAKTLRGKVKGAIADIVAGHPYETPAVVAIPVVAGAERYLAWINEEAG
jgi:periplasmic divalent cation tolerance protein